MTIAPELYQLSFEDLGKLDPGRIPRHVAVIMDGNRRWARRNPLAKVSSMLSGHWRGAEVLTPVVEAAADIGVKYLTVYAFSTENWKRPPHEVSTLMLILEKFLKNQCARMVAQGVRLETIGELSGLPKRLQKELAKTKAKTAGGKRIQLTLALNYGARHEMMRAVRQIVEQGHAPSDINEQLIDQHLDTALMPDPDLYIRTSGEMRLSNFLLWQASYAEIYVTKTLWPDFEPEDLLEAVFAYQQRNRREGQ